jgi:hydrogenase maturation protease
LNNQKTVLIIASGNPIRSDDGLAWHAAHELEDYFDAPDVEIRCAQQLMPELSEIISRSQLVIFVDATEEGTPGEVCCAMIGERLQNTGGGSHQLTPAELIAMAQVLYGNKPSAFSVTVCGENFDHGEGLSSKVAAAMPQLVKTIAELVKQA